MWQSISLAWIQKFADRIIYMKEGRIEREFTSSMSLRTLSDSEARTNGTQEYRS